MANYSDGNPPPPGRTGKQLFVLFLRFLKVLSVLSLVSNIVAYIFVCKGAADATNLSGLDKTFVILANIGYIFLSLMLIVSEFDPLWLQRVFLALHYWGGRGFGLAWIGVQTIYSVKQLAAAVSGSGGDTALFETFGTVIGWILISVGLLYVVMSLLCVRRILGEAEQNVRLIGGDNVTHTTVNVTAPASPAGMSDGDKLLMLNMALALGMTTDDARRRFGGKGGQKEAERFVKERIAPAAVAAYAASPALGVVSSSKNDPPPPPYEPPPMRGGGSSSSAAKGTDDELERLYYAGKS